MIPIMKKYYILDVKEGKKVSKQKKPHKILFQVILVAFLFFLFLLMLYFFNNKYTAKGTQAMNGILTISEEDLKEDPVLYLIHGWQFYPGQLLTPSDFESGEDVGFCQTVSIGQYMDFSLGHRDWDPIGSATYRLNLSLPETPHVYTLYLEEVFSSYHVYANGQLVHSVGNPEPEHYQEAITNSEISFTASGNTELIIAVTNHSYYYSGITFPPSFGLSEAVARIQHIQLLVCMAFLTTLVICAVIAFYFTRYCLPIRKRTLLYCLICTSLFITFSYRIMSTLFTVKADIWYPLELFSIYSVYLFAVLLFNDIREIPLKKSLCISLPLLIFCMATFIYGFTSHHSQAVNLAFQYGSRIIKIATAAYLLYNALSAVLYDENDSPVLLTGAAVVAVSIFTDRLLPLYEPIYGSWFVEYGMFFLVLCFGFIIIRNLTLTYKQQLVFQEEQRLLKRQLAMQQMHYAELSDKIENSIRLRHDERHRLNTISSLLDNGEIEQLKEYLKEYTTFSKAEERTVMCTNLTIDAILQFYKHLCDQTEIKFVTEIDIPSRIPISDIDLSSLFSNLIENAYEACIDQEPDNPYIYIMARYRQDTLLLRIKNNISRKPIPLQKGLFKSTKHEGAGIGTQSVRTIVHNYDGQIKYDITDNSFLISVILPGERKN